MADQDESVTDERTTAYVIETLENDVSKALARLTKGQTIKDFNQLDEADLRDCTRTIFAYIEGVTFSVKMWVVTRLFELDAVTEEERLAASEMSFELRDGAVVDKPMKVSLAENIKFTFKLMDRLFSNKTPTIDTGKQWWSDFKKAVRIRDRLMHPKMPASLDVTAVDFALAVKVWHGFKELLTQFDYDGANEGVRIFLDKKKLQGEK
jgi:hypothetical protein